MTAAQIQSELIGKTICTTGKTVVCVKHNPGGKSQVLSGTDKQTGVWRFDGNKHCAKWEKIRGGKELCATFDKTGSTYSHSSSGKLTVK